MAFGFSGLVFVRQGGGHSPISSLRLWRVGGGGAAFVCFMPSEGLLPIVEQATNSIVR